MVSHKPGPFKQDKKSHKHGKHKSKGNLAVKGKTGKLKVHVKSTTLTKVNRKNREQQLRRMKVMQSNEEKRELGSKGHPPVCVAFLPAHPGVDLSSTIDFLKTHGGLPSPSQHSFYFYCKKFKKRLQLVFPSDNLFEQLDTVKCADLLVLVWDSSYHIDPLLRTCLLGQGLPPVQHLVLDDVGTSEKEKIQRRKHFSDTLQQHFSSRNTKVHYVKQLSDLETVLWGVVNFKHHTLSFLQHRSYILSSFVDFQPIDSLSGTLKITGYVRGQSMDANQLVHIPGYGHFRIQRIESAEEPFSESSHLAHLGIISEASNPPTLEMECIVDEMDAEQTWPTEEELAQAEQINKHTKRVPKGTSAYQAVWMLSDDDEEELSNEEEEEEEEEEEDEEEEEEEEFEELTSQETSSKDYDVEFDAEVEAQELKKFREASEQEQFPDEIDTPIDTPARIRFQKYRGLKSFRTSPWDPKENLPRDYARISQISNFRNVRRHLLRPESRSVPCGAYVHIFIENVPLSIRDNAVRSMAVYTLLPNEQKMSVQHVLQHRHLLSTSIVKGKEQILVQVGFRRYLVQPIFSQHTKSNKHKMERFMPHSGSFVASYYAPITLSDCPAMLFKLEEDGSVTLLSTGALLPCDPDRVICKRAALSGHPFKIHKRSATVRYLFHNREDITYFKPVEIKTKHGRRGHIKEALGTHGHCKIAFDKPIQQCDTVLMCLYKRVFPKWYFHYG